VTRTLAARPIGGWVSRGDNTSIPFGSHLVADNCEISEDLLRTRAGRMRLNVSAPGKASLEGRIAYDGYGIVKAHSLLNPSTTQFTLEATIRLPKIVTYAAASTYMLLFRGGNGAGTVIYDMYLSSTGSAVSVKVEFTAVNTGTLARTTKILSYTLTAGVEDVEGYLLNVALRRGGTAGGTATLMELVVNGAVKASYSLSTEGLWGDDTIEALVTSSRELMDLYVLNHSPDFTYGTLITTQIQADPRVSEIRWWSTARTDALLTTWKATELSSTQVALSGLVGYWPCNAGGGRYETNQKTGNALGALYRMANTPIWRVSSQIEYLGRDHLVRVPYVNAYDRVASQNLALAVKTWTWMLRFTTGNYLQNYLTTTSTDDDRRMVLLQWGYDPTVPQVRVSILKAAGNFNLVVETYHNATLKTMTSSTNLAAGTTYTFWVTRNGTALSLYLNNGTSTVATATIGASDNTYGTGITDEILIGAGVTSSANAGTYSHTQFFYGTLDELRLYARVVENDVRTRTYSSDLSQADIEADPDLLLCMEFGDGVGGFAKDSSKSANTGLLTRNFTHTTTTQWLSKRPVRWAPGFVTAQTAPPFNMIGTYVKPGVFTETVVGIAGGIAYELDATAATLTALPGEVAPDEAVSSSKPYSTVGLANRLYFADGRNPIGAIDRSVVRPCGIADLPASAVPGITQAGPGNLLGYYAYAVQTGSAFTGALSRAVKTAASRFRSERAIVGYGTGRPGGSYYTFNGTTAKIVSTAAAECYAATYTHEVWFRPTSVLTERGECRAVRLTAGSNESIVSGDTAGTVNSISHPLNEFTYELRYRWQSAPGASKRALSHPQNTGGGNAGIGTIEIASTGTNGNVTVKTWIGGATTIATLTIATATNWVTVSVVHRATGWEVYVDGALVATSTAAVPDALATRPVYIGQDGGGSNFGSVDAGEFRLWDYARSAGQIADNYRTEITDVDDLARLTLYWKMNDGSGSLLQNSSTKLGGHDAYIGKSASASPTQQTNPTHQYNPTRQVIFAINDNVGVVGTTSIELVDLDSSLVVQYRGAASGNTIQSFKTTGIEANRWHVFQHTRDDSTSVEKFYLDNVLLSTTTLLTPDVTAAGIDVVAGADDSTNFFTGDIDEIRVWNVVRTAAQLTANSGNEIDPVPSTLILYWRFDGTAVDSSASARNGTVTAATVGTMSGGQIPFGIEDGITARRVYRSAGFVPASEDAADLATAKATAEAGPFYLITEIDDNTTTQVADNTADEDLSSIRLDEDHAGNPPAGRIVYRFGDRLGTAAPPGATKSLFVSGIGETENFDVVGDSLDVEDDRSASITAAADYTAISKQAALFTESGIFSLQESGGRLELVSLVTGTGCLSPLGAVRIEDSIYFWSRSGPMVFRQGGLTPIYATIEKPVRSINLAAYTTTGAIIAAHHAPRKQVWFAVPEAGSTLDAIYKYDYAREKWVGRDTVAVRALAQVSPLTLVSGTNPASALLADSLGYITLPDSADMDGAPNSSAFGANTFKPLIAVGGTGTTLTTGTFLLPTSGDGLKGVTILLYYPNGTEETTTITANTVSTITVSPAVTAPSATTYAALGYIDFVAESGWLDGRDERYGPAVTSKVFGFFQCFFDNDHLGQSDYTDANAVGGVPVFVETAVLDRSYPISATYDQTIATTIPDNTQGVSGVNVALAKRIFVPNALGRFFRYRIKGRRAQVWGVHQVAIEIDASSGF